MDDRVSYIRLEFSPDKDAMNISVETQDKLPLTIAQILQGISHAQSELIAKKISGKLKLNWDGKPKVTIGASGPEEIH